MIGHVVTESNFYNPLAGPIHGGIIAVPFYVAAKQGAALVQKLLEIE